MAVLKVTVWDKSDHRKKKLICASDPASLPEARKALSAVVGRFDTLDKIEGSSTLLILDVVRARQGRDFQVNDWNSKKDLTKEA